MRAAAALALALALATALRLPAAWESGNSLNHVSGTWMTLADDLALSNQDGAHERVRMRRAAAFLRQLDRPPEETLVHRP